MKLLVQVTVVGATHPRTTLQTTTAAEILDFIAPSSLTYCFFHPTFAIELTPMCRSHLHTSTILC
ncbi:MULTISPECIES: hypothetical protein [unclassified Microcoleus]|uniref:hypothetical protein n=1 Tax=unclassified Microcoleus TaxID=2642155 RepID=UPI001E086249|nr:MULTISPECIES: hypothetical protein [unclassified Microcoleus]MCC3463945.1 hypothetical protein [Microcoleus sp. PH2017_11_PCY_U_A]